MHARFRGAKSQSESCVAAKTRNPANETRFPASRESAARSEADAEAVMATRLEQARAGALLAAGIRSCGRSLRLGKSAVGPDTVGATTDVAGLKT